MIRFLATILLILPLLLLPKGMARAEGSISLIRDAEIEATLDMLSSPIFQAASLPEGSVDIFILSDDSINAFVSGRNMAFNSGLLMKMEDPKELLGVIAHETGHLAGAHAFQRGAAAGTARGISVATTILGIAAAAAGAPQAGLAITAGGQRTARRSLMKYSRGQESAADQAALSYMQAAGFDPAGLMLSLKRLESTQLLSDTVRDPYALSHPLTNRRIARVERNVASSSLKGRDISTEAAYWHERMRAKLKGFTQRPSRVLRDTRDDNSEFALIARTVAYHRAPEPRKAIENMDRLLAMRPNDPFFQELKAQILFEAGDNRAALAPARRAVSLLPQEPLLRVQLGAILLSFGNDRTDREALSELRNAALQDRNDARAWRLLALAENKAGNLAQAALAGAEYQAIRGEDALAVREAERAQMQSPRGSPVWLRAEDILSILRR